MEALEVSCLPKSGALAAVLRAEAVWYVRSWLGFLPGFKLQVNPSIDFGFQVAIKTMKKTFESFAPCLELREVIFLQKLPPHPHLVPALDIFLDPTSRKLHIAMEYMDGNLYQLMKSRDHKCLDQTSVKSILWVKSLSFSDSKFKKVCD